MNEISNDDTTAANNHETIGKQTIDISINRSATVREQSKKRTLPLMMKRANKVEKYISELAQKTIQRSKGLRSRYTTQVSNEVSQGLGSGKEQRSKPVFVSALEQIGSHRLSSKTVQHQNIIVQDSLSRLETLNKMEEDYVDLKQKLKENPITLPRLNRMIKTQQDQVVTISQIQNKLKKNTIEISGRKYYKDLYLVTKGRDKIFTSLSKIGDYKLGASSLSVYSEIVNEVKSHQEYVSQAQEVTKKQILNQRKQKKGKMIENKYMNGHVYYDYHSLSKKERGNVKNVSKFAVNYGIK